jgi:hypothetical protein
VDVILPPPPSLAPWPTASLYENSELMMFYDTELADGAAAGRPDVH